MNIPSILSNSVLQNQISYSINQTQPLPHNDDFYLSLIHVDRYRSATKNKTSLLNFTRPANLKRCKTQNHQSYGSVIPHKIVMNIQRIFNHPKVSGKDKANDFLRITTSSVSTKNKQKNVFRNTIFNGRKNSSIVAPPENIYLQLKSTIKTEMQNESSIFNNYKVRNKNLSLWSTSGSQKERISPNAFIKNYKRMTTQQIFGQTSSILKGSHKKQKTINKLKTSFKNARFSYDIILSGN